MGATSCMHFCVVNSFPVYVSASRIETGTDIIYIEGYSPRYADIARYFLVEEVVHASIHGMPRQFLNTLQRGAVVFLL